jgi:hypothetical protein
MKWWHWLAVAVGAALAYELLVKRHVLPLLSGSSARDTSLSDRLRGG